MELAKNRANFLLQAISDLGEGVDDIRPKMKQLNQTAFAGTVYTSFFKELSKTIIQTDMKLRFYFEKWGVVALWEEFESCHSREKYDFKGADQLDHDWAYLRGFDSWTKKSTDLLEVVQIIESQNYSVVEVNVEQIDSTIERYLDSHEPSDEGYRRRYELLMEFRTKVNALELQKKESTVMTQNFNIGSINSDQVQVGNENTQNITININEVVERIAASDDEQAKSQLKSLLENNTVASVIGAGVSGLIALL
ncbi:TPA: hypothetical protein ACX3F9_004496 [Vibrio parahaemolyticus]